MEQLIPVISKLQDVFATVGSPEKEVQLPQIVVVGSQSSGKSSLIEGIVGRDFLPRGSGMVTRRPLLLHLVQALDKDQRRSILSDNVSYDSDWAVFGHKPMVYFTNFEEVRTEIENETNRTTGPKEIWHEPITLTVYSNRVVNLSLIDLPGITKVAVEGQPHNIEEQIYAVIKPYVENPNSLILAVTPANQDFANSEALKLAKKVDPDGERTLAVLTKLDLMDMGTDARAVLAGRDIKVKLGIIGVVNRSQADINANKSIQSCLVDEARFLKSNYPEIASSNGIPYMSKRLSTLLINHIFKCLPALRDRVKDMTKDYQALMVKCGEPVIDKRMTMIQLIGRFAHDYNSAIQGSTELIVSSGICGGARIRQIFDNHFPKELEDINPLSGLSMKKIHLVAENAMGVRKHTFLPQQTFELLASEQIALLEEPSLHCVDEVHEEMLKIERNLQGERFPNIYHRIRGIFLEMMDANLSDTKSSVSDCIANQRAYIDCPQWEELIYYIKSMAANSENEQQNSGEEHIRESPPLTLSDILNSFPDIGDGSPDKCATKEERECAAIAELIRNYFTSVRETVEKQVPKIIMRMLVNKVQGLHDVLLHELCNDSEIENLLLEDVMLVEKREHASQMLAALKKANALISEVSEMRIQ